VREFELLAGEKGLHLTCEIEVPGAIVLFDEYCLSKILYSLLDNAVKFTSSGEVSVRLRRDAGRGLLLEVRDTGVGVDPSFAPRIFEPFSQEEPSGSRGFEGPGLGLAVAQRFADLHGARITVDSEKGKGSVFVIAFGGVTVDHPPPPGDRSPQDVTAA
jgi:signal transduction histidine kinase